MTSQTPSRYDAAALEVDVLIEAGHPSRVSDDRRAFALVVINAQAWRRVDLLEHYLITRQVDEEKARELVDTYPHHLLHVHESEDD